MSQPVYEAWILYRSPDTRDIITRTKICGIKVWSEYEDNEGFVTSRTEPREQDDLKSTTLAAVEQYHADTKRCLPSRLVRGRPKTYEQHLDNRIRKLPTTIQTEINRLLSDREVASSNRFHRRDWTVVMMREQLHYRFASAAYQEVKKHNMRFWKNKDGKQPVEYFVVLKGGEGMVATDDKGLRTPRRHGNPWKTVDDEEELAKMHARQVRHHGKEGIQLRNERYGRRRERSVSPPPPPRYPHMRRASFERSRSVSPAPPPFPSYRFGPMGMVPDPNPDPWMRCPGMNSCNPPPPPGNYLPFGANPYGLPRPSYMPFARPPGPLPVPPPPPMGGFGPSSSNRMMHYPPPPPPLPQPMPPQLFSMPPPAPRLSNLTTPTTFQSPATTNHTGSSASSASASVSASTSNTTPPRSDDIPVQPHFHKSDSDLIFGDQMGFKNCQPCITRLVVLSSGGSDDGTSRGLAFTRAAKQALKRLRVDTDEDSADEDEDDDAASESSVGSEGLIVDD